jgi:UDP-N-acetylglucosamine acyltransferase
VGHTKIHSSAIVDSDAILDDGVEIGAFAIIGPKVSIAAQTKIGPHAVIDGKTKIGKNNLISAFSSIGSRPQDLKFKGEETTLEIGDGNMFREYSNVSLGTAGGGGRTVIGNHNLFMVNTHVAHDCNIGNHVIVANCVALAGHVEVGDGAVLGGMAAVHQFCRIGKYSMTAGGAMVTQDVVPYGMVHGDRARVNGLNIIGLRRLGVKPDDLKSIKEMYRLVFDANLTVEDAVKKIEDTLPDSTYRTEWIEFLRRGERGLCR